MEREMKGEEMEREIERHTQEKQGWRGRETREKDTEREV